MSLRYWSVRAVALTVLCASLAMSAGIPAAGAPLPTTPNGTAVRGVVWNGDNSPVPGAKVRLRNLQTGRVEANAVSDETGRFAFANVHGGSYAVELIGNDGKVVAVGQSFRVESGETVGTFVRLAPRQPWFTGVLANTAATVISAASSAGVTAIGSHAPPVSPQ